MTTARSAGFYWIRTFGVWNYEKPAFDRLAYVAPVIAEWTGARWCISGYSAGVDLDVLDADVLAGPLQAPRIGPGEDHALFESAEDIEQGDLVSLDLSDNKIRKTPLVPIVPTLDANVAREASIAAYWRRRHAIVDGTLERLDAEFVAATTRPDGSVDYAASRPVKADLSGWAGPLVSGEENWARARIATLNRRARALLEGTTPGPWETIEDVGDCQMMILGDKRAPVPGLERSTCVASLAHDDAEADAAFILGAHALLTELAKEET